MDNKAEFPKDRTTFLVIHGIGEQNPFETLDSFSRGMIDYLRSERIEFHATHRITERKDLETPGWQEKINMSGAR